MRHEIYVHVTYHNSIMLHAHLSSTLLDEKAGKGAANHEASLQDLLRSVWETHDSHCRGHPLVQEARKIQNKPGPTEGFKVEPPWENVLHQWDILPPKWVWKQDLFEIIWWAKATLEYKTVPNLEEGALLLPILECLEYPKVWWINISYAGRKQTHSHSLLDSIILVDS